ncbi:MAG: thymidine phosphorylase [Armatimonadota bacterium]|nr:thymidine phosphorylase [Armatimonadota bacterium]
MIRPAELIQKKRDGGALSGEEIGTLVRGFVAGDIPDYQMAAFLMAVFFRGLSADETSALTQAMVRSGEVLDLGPLAGRAVDKHSSGGVGDKTSLVLVPLVASAGVPVPKLSGRGLGHTGGTLDKLESIPGFRTNLTTAEFIEQVGRVGCAIAGQSASIVPADAKLYALRDVTATVESIPLIAASIMSKKLAAGAGAILLDVKCGRGAFMKTEDAARELAQTMVEIGRTAGRRVAAAITGMDVPLGRAVGNALEVAEAIATLRGEGPPDLHALCLDLGGWMLVLGGRAATPGEGRVEVERRLRSGDGLARLAAMIEAQDGDAGVIEHPERLPRASVQVVVPSPGAGVIAAIDAAGIGLAAMRLGAGRIRKGDPVDSAAGVVLIRVVGEAVRAGDPIAVVHAPDPTRADAAVREVAAAYAIGEHAPPQRPLIRTVVQEADHGRAAGGGSG